MYFLVTRVTFSCGGTSGTPNLATYSGTRMQNPWASMWLKPGGRDVNIAKQRTQVDIGQHRRKWKSPILGVARIVLHEVLLASFFLSTYVEPKLFFAFAQENSPVHPLLLWMPEAV